MVRTLFYYSQISSFLAYSGWHTKENNAGKFFYRIISFFYCVVILKRLSQTCTGSTTDSLSMLSVFLLNKDVAYIYT